jgi:hypothetical protein
MPPMASDPDFTSGNLLCVAQPALCAHARDADQVLAAHYVRCGALPFEVVAAGEICV